MGFEPHAGERHELLGRAHTDASIAAWLLSGGLMAMAFAMLGGAAAGPYAVPVATIAAFGGYVGMLWWADFRRPVGVVIEHGEITVFCWDKRRFTVPVGQVTEVRQVQQGRLLGLRIAAGEQVGKVLFVGADLRTVTSHQVWLLQMLEEQVERWGRPEEVPTSLGSLARTTREGTNLDA